MYPLKANAAFCRRLIEPVTLPPLGRVRREEGPPPPRTLGGATPANRHVLDLKRGELLTREAPVSLLDFPRSARLPLARI